METFHTKDSARGVVAVQEPHDRLLCALQHVVDLCDGCATVGHHPDVPLQGSHFLADIQASHLPLGVLCFSTFQVSNSASKQYGQNISIHTPVFV